MSGGKGDRRRPSKVSREQYEANWDLAFKKEPKDLPSRSVVRKRETMPRRRGTEPTMEGLCGIEKRRR